MRTAMGSGRNWRILGRSAIVSMTMICAEAATTARRTFLIFDASLAIFYFSNLKVGGAVLWWEETAALNIHDDLHILLLFPYGNDQSSDPKQTSPLLFRPASFQSKSFN